jgi:glycosyltransferase involved in cell wall biosynthesis
MPQQPLLYRGTKVTTVHDLTLLKTYNTDKNWLVYHLKQLVGRMVFWLIGRTNTTIITPSHYTKNEYQKFSSIDQKKIIVTYEATNIPAHDTQSYKLLFKKYLLYVGQQSDYKNVHRLISAHQKLLDKHPDLGLVFVGKKDTLTSRNEKWVQENTYKNIVFTGFVSDAELSYLYKNSLVYVFPSLMEGFGLPGLEAMAHGAPVASSNVTCLPEVYGEAAHYFDPMSVEDMSQKINEIITNQKLRDKLITLGYQQVKKYSWATMAEQTHSVYLAALERNDRS